MPVVLPDGITYLTTREVARRLNVSRTWVKAIATELHAVRIPSGHRYRFAFPPASVDAYAAKRAARSIKQAEQLGATRSYEAAIAAIEGSK